ncbi:peptidase C60 [Actinoplanes awajinensis subsp. mycoplanecinus]|uniref:Peptidase C60 n=1 Tax=Actinoplanes awajinensis subsp. mycoplanecinus TaxID=135947 RepID=A0A101JLW1_9ACTN|nr:peptidase C60 [Actinoplanes awajinensis subsp. mycoplanecinus]
MAGADHPAPAATKAGSRWGRYALPAAVLVLAAVGITALVTGAREQPHQPPLAASVVGAAPPEGAVTPAGTAPSAGAAATSTAAGGTLTVGPLMSTSVPTRVVIPALDVDVPLTGLGLQADGAMQVPTDAKTVGWYTRAPTPGALGPAVLAGHVDFKNKPGTFNKLTDLKAGDSINVDRADGSMAMFRVVKVDRYAKDRFPTDAVYGAINRAGLRLITCGGDFDSAAGHYEDNIVVYADLAMAHPA